MENLRTYLARIDELNKRIDFLSSPVESSGMPILRENGRVRARGASLRTSLRYYYTRSVRLRRALGARRGSDNRARGA